RGAEAGVEEQPARRRRRPRQLRDAQRLVLAQAAGFRRDARGVGDAVRRAFARAADDLLVPEAADLVPRRDLPGDADVAVLPGAVRELRTRGIGRVRPLRGIARVVVVEDVRDDLRAALRAGVGEVPDLVFADRPADRSIEVVHLVGRRRGREPLILQRLRQVVRLELLARAAEE